MLTKKIMFLFMFFTFHKTTEFQNISIIITIMYVDMCIFFLFFLLIHMIKPHLITEKMF